MTTGERVAAVVGGVVRQAMADAGARALIVLDDGSLEATLAHDWCAAAIGANFVALARGAHIAKELPRVLAAHPAGRELSTIGADMLGEEARRMEARLLAFAAGGKVLVANPANKTALLLGVAAPPEPLLPLGDLYATDVLQLAGGWTAPPAVRALAEAAGGIEALDSALRAHFDERRSLQEALVRLPEEVRSTVAEAVTSTRFARRRMGIVPKLGPRTLGLDLFA